MGRIIAVASQKGGSAKTTTTIHLGAGIAALGKRVLLVDIDPQGHLAEGLGYSAGELKQEISTVLDKKVPLADILLSPRKNLDLAPSNIRLSHLEPYLFTQNRREDRLKFVLSPVRDNYDFIVIDCPPNLGILTVNALSATDYVLIPMAGDYYGMLGVSLLLDTINEMKAEINPDLKILGILPTRFTRTTHTREVLERTKAELGDSIHIYDFHIPESVRFREATALGKTIFEYEPDSAGAQAYKQLAEEVVHGKS